MLLGVFAKAWRSHLRVADFEDQKGRPVLHEAQLASLIASKPGQRVFPEGAEAGHCPLGRLRIPQMFAGANTPRLAPLTIGSQHTDSKDEANHD